MTIAVTGADPKNVLQQYESSGLYHIVVFLQYHPKVKGGNGKVLVN